MTFCKWAPMRYFLSNRIASCLMRGMKRATLEGADKGEGTHRNRHPGWRVYRWDKSLTARAKSKTADWLMEFMFLFLRPLFFYFVPAPLSFQSPCKTMNRPILIYAHEIIAETNVCLSCIFLKKNSQIWSHNELVALVIESRFDNFRLWINNK